MRQGHHIEDVWERLGHASVADLIKATGYSLGRILDHVNWAIHLGYAKLAISAVNNRKTTPPRHKSTASTSDGQAPPAPDAVDLVTPPPERVPTTVHRIIRDTELARRVKVLHRFKCQICGHTIQLPDGSFYAEAHHIQPLGQPHNGLDDIGNILCVCPNHHAELDYGVIKITLPELVAVEGHIVAAKFVDYHNQTICPFR